MLDDILIDAMIELVNEMLKGLQFNRKIDGVITAIVEPNMYEVQIQNKAETIKSMNNYPYQVGDIVDIIVFNSNYSDKKILCKK